MERESIGVSDGSHVTVQVGNTAYPSLMLMISEQWSAQGVAVAHLSFEHISWLVRKLEEYALGTYERANQEVST